LFVLIIELEGALDLQASAFAVRTLAKRDEKRFDIRQILHGADSRDERGH